MSANGANCAVSDALHVREDIASKTTLNRKRGRNVRIVTDFGDLDGFAELLAELELTDDLGPDNGFGANPAKKRKDSGTGQTVTRIVYDHRKPGEGLVTETMAYHGRIRAAEHLFNNHPYRRADVTYDQLSPEAKRKWLILIRDAINIYNQAVGRNL